MSRIWEPFLTPDDVASLRERKHQVWGYGRRPSLVLIDLFRWVFGDEPQPLAEAQAIWPRTCGLRAWDALPHLQRLLAAARGAGIPIVHVTGLHPEDSGIPLYTDAPGRRPADVDLEMAARLRRRFEIMPEVAPIPGEAIIEKNAPSGFFGTLLMSHLNALGVDGVILAGESTSGCVRATCVDGRSYRLMMTVAEECVFDRHETSHAISLFDMHEKYADVLGVDEVVEHLRNLSVGTRTSA